MNLPRILRRILKPFYPQVRPLVHQLFYSDLIAHTDNFSRTSWLGHRIWQQVLDLWTIQETIAEIRPELLIECGTNQGGAALFYAHLFALLNQGRVVTIAIEKSHDLDNPRITFLLGSSVEDKIVAQVKEHVAKTIGPVMVILDSDHSAEHVAKELDIYHQLVTPRSFILVQDGIMDLSGQTGPLRAILDFLPKHPEFEVDHERCNRFLLTHHPQGWLRRR